MLSAGKRAGLGTCIIAQEGPLRGDGDPLPDADGLGVSWISTLRLLIEAPVPVSESTGLWACLERERIPHGAELSLGRSGVCGPVGAFSL